MSGPGGGSEPESGNEHRSETRGAGPLRPAALGSGQGLIAVAGVFVLTLASYACYWQGRDWNAASRLMLTYAMGDRGTIRLDGLSEQTRDIAFFQGHYYTDKLPGYSMIGLPVYLAAKATKGLEPHPLDRAGMTHWPADYWVTLGTSGLATAALSAWVVAMAMRLGCSPRMGVVLGLAYGIGTPAYVYGTLAYGHQLTALFLMIALAMIATPGVAANGWRMSVAGFCAAMACVVELQAAPAAAVLAGVGLGVVIRTRRPAWVGWALLGGIPPFVGLAAYNMAAFGSATDMGYFHHATAQFARVHSEENPLGLMNPDWSKLGPLLWGGYRGLLFYAPIVAAAPLGWYRMLRDGKWAIGLGTLGVCLAVMLVNLSYPEWTGGWSTGPRLLVPLLPFAVVAVGGFVAGGRGRGSGEGRPRKGDRHLEDSEPGPYSRAQERVAAAVSLLVLGLAVGGFVVNTLFIGVGGRIAQDIGDPLMQAVWPAWAGKRGIGLPGAERFVRNVVAWTWPEWVKGLRPGEQWKQMAPIVGGQVVAAIVLAWVCGMRRKRWGKIEQG